MNKLTVTFTFLFFVGALLSGIMEGGGGIVTTRLTADLSSTAVTMTVNNTSGFLDSGYVVLQNERVRYTGTTPTTLTGLTRGYDNTVAAVHNAPGKVYSPSSSIINYALGFDIATTGTTVGAISMPIFFWRFITTSIPRLVMWDFNYLKEGEMQYIRWLLMVISTGFVLTASLKIASAMGGVARAILVR
ncbi:hypothetical protein LCGC14_0721270 [marine sediment metagenome]|uniref:Uncharacterized protein n=1 Tax=marine sediment metagenome TaxID=412755 RepID=A0A0F9QXD5_9ZZZZ